MDVAALRNEIKGEVLQGCDTGYQPALDGMLWNRLKADRRPDLIIRVHDEEDIIKAVRFADASSLRVVARGGGHSWCGLAARSGGMLIDLENLNKVKVEPGLMRASIQPFVSNREVIAHLEPYGLAFPTGHCPQVNLVATCSVAASVGMPVFGARPAIASRLSMQLQRKANACELTVTATRSSSGLRVVGAPAFPVSLSATICSFIECPKQLSKAATTIHSSTSEKLGIGLRTSRKSCQAGLSSRCSCFPRLLSWNCSALQ
ncbi:MAG: FAD-dependent oxidoreductase [Deltaproteobacteria bacterium]|nr:FAD-dependent oxidoreductase [Deltaproteobacteria bacterium]